ESRHAPQQSAEIHSVPQTPRAAADFPAAIPAAEPRAALTASTGPDPPASAENRMHPPSSLSPLLPPTQTPSAESPEWTHPHAWSRAAHPGPKLLASSNP